MATTETIESFIGAIAPLDLLVFRGGDFVSKLIGTIQTKVTGTGEATHVGLAINRKVCPALRVDDDDLYVWESTMSGSLNDGVLNAETGSATFGVQVRRLRDVITAYTAADSADIGYAALINRPAPSQERMIELYNKYNGRRYDANPLNLLGAAFPRLRRLRAALEKIGTDQWLFCSEFVASVYIDLGIIVDESDGVIDGRIIDPKNVLPVDLLGADTEAPGEGLVQPIVHPPLWLKKSCGSKKEP